MVELDICIPFSTIFCSIKSSIQVRRCYRLAYKHLDAVEEKSKDVNHFVNFSFPLNRASFAMHANLRNSLSCASNPEILSST
jgi:hypothetical protein